MEGKYSDKIDLYSIGIILYVLKTGDKFLKNFFDFLVNLRNNTIENKNDDEKLNNLIKKLIVSDHHKRMDWKEYFDDPFFKVNDKGIEENLKCKNTNLNLDKKLNYECTIII